MTTNKSMLTRTYFVSFKNVNLLLKVFDVCKYFYT